MSRNIIKCLHLSSNVTMLRLNKIPYHFSLRVIPSRCHEMSWNVFQFNTMTFDDMSWCGQSDSERKTSSWMVFVCNNLHRIASNIGVVCKDNHPNKGREKGEHPEEEATYYCTPLGCPHCCQWIGSLDTRLVSSEHRHTCSIDTIFTDTSEYSDA